MSEIKEQQPAYISRVHLKGYKSIRDLEIDFKAGLNIIIGPNGSGKTNFLEFLEFSISPFKGIPNKKEEILIRQDFLSSVEIFDIAGKKVDWNSKGNYKISSPKKTHQFVITEVIKVNNDICGGKEIIFANGNERPEIKANNRIWDETYDIGVVEYLRFDNPLNLLLNQGIKLEAVLVDMPYLTDGNAKIDDSYFIVIIDEPLSLDGVEQLIHKSFNNTYLSIPLKDRFNMSQEFKNILSRFTNIKDFDFDLGIARVYDTKKLDNLFFKFFVNNKWLYWNQLSDGTKRLFYIFVNVFFADSIETGPIFIEEPELGIHPDQLYLLMDFLKEQSKEKQIIITTHSPEVLNILEKDELDRIIITRFDGDKGTQMHHLSPKKIRKGVNYMSKEGLTLKDFWVHSNLEEYDEEEYEVR